MPNFEFKQPKSIEDLKKTIEQGRGKLTERLKELNNSYHNEQHANEVLQAITNLTNNLSRDDILSERQKLLLQECARRHDDGHAGNTFRQ